MSILQHGGDNDMALTKTKYDGLYCRLDKNGKKVYVARIYKDGKDTTKRLVFFDSALVELIETKKTLGFANGGNKK